MLKIRTWWETADRTTRTVTLVGGGLFVALLIGVYYFASSPDMRQLFPPLDAAEQGRVVQKLQELKIPYRQEPDGSIFVPSPLIAEARAKLAQDGIPSGSALGYTRLDKMGFTDPQALQDQKLRVALEEELQKSIEMMTPVLAAKVHLAPGSDSPFVSDTTEASASIVVQLAPGVNQPREVANSIVSTVSFAVQGLKKNQISVTDSNGVVLWDGESNSGIGSIASDKRQAELAEAERITNAIQQMIDRSVGPGKAVVRAECEMNFDREELVTESTTPSNEPIESTTIRESYGSHPTGAQPPATPATPAASRSGDGYELSQSNEKRTANYSKSIKEVAAGNIVSARVSIMLDESASSARQQITEFASNLIGANRDPEKFSVMVTTAPFDNTLAEQAKKDLAAAKSSQMLQQIFSLLPIVVLIVVGFLVIRSISKAAASNTNILVASSSLPASTLRSAYVNAPSAVSTSLPAPDRQTAPSVQTEEELSDTVRRRASAIRSTMRPEVDDIPEKFDVTLEQILRMADTRPESVALLVKSWLLEETN